MSSEQRTMNTLIVIFLGFCFSLSYTSKNVRMIPRLTQSNPEDWTFSLPTEQPNAVFYLKAPNSLYIGGEEVLYHYEFRNEITPYEIKANKICSDPKFCKNFVTFVTWFDGHLLVCGTNAYYPACWKMDGGKFEKHDTSWAEQLSPRYPGFNYNILQTDKELYSTIPKVSNNPASTQNVIFRKILGDTPMRFTCGNLLKNPEFIKSLTVGKQKTDSRIFLFFMDDNSELRTTDKRVPMIARMCKDEMGSYRPDERNMFSTALKSRLICGNPGNSTTPGQYYNILQDIFSLQSNNLIYGLFTNSWDQSAVCSYKIENIESVFNTSDLFGSERKNLTDRPGQCLLSRTSQETADEVANHPELVDWVWPENNRPVFQSLDYYRKLVVDEIASENQTYRVIIVATDSGSLHKIVEQEDKDALNVLEIKPFNTPRKILYLHLHQNNTEHVVYVGTAKEISRIPLDDCRAYNKTCTQCCESRDPYCSWYKGKCQSIFNRSHRHHWPLLNQQRSHRHHWPLLKQKRIALLQDPNQRCEYEPRPSLERLQSSLPETKVLPPTVYYLTCPAESKQATYWWTYGDNQKEMCTPHNGQCNLFFESLEEPRVYKCMQQESSQQRLVAEYTFPLGSASRSEALPISMCVILNICVVLFANS